MKLDQATSGIDNLQYARIMIEVRTGQEFPEKLHFITERNKMMEVPIQYEWKPIQYESCKLIGHEVSVGIYKYYKAEFHESYS